jgi:hypothetical protein
MVMGMTSHEAIEWLNAIKEKYIHGGDDYYDRQRRFAIDWAILLLKKDAVPVVRCKDCKHYFHYGDGVYGCRTYGMMKTEHDGFCSCGERKDNERKAD